MEATNEDQAAVSAVTRDPAVPRSAQARRQRKLGVVDLARRLSVNPRTIYKWLVRGAPVSLDEAATREWCRMNGIRGLRAPLTIEVPRSTADAPGTTPSPASAGAAPGLSAIAPPEGWSPAQRKAIADAGLSDDRRRKVQLEIGELERRLVPREDLVAIVGSLSMVYVHALIDLPAAAVRTLDRLPVEWQKPVRRAIEEAIVSLRGNLEATLRAQLVADLRKAGVARAS